MATGEWPSVLCEVVDPRPVARYNPPLPKKNHAHTPRYPNACKRTPAHPALPHCPPINTYTHTHASPTNSNSANILVGRKVRAGAPAGEMRAYDVARTLKMMLQILCKFLCCKKILAVRRGEQRACVTCLGSLRNTQVMDYDVTTADDQMAHATLPLASLAAVAAAAGPGFDASRDYAPDGAVRPRSHSFTLSRSLALALSLSISLFRKLDIRAATACFQNKSLGPRRQRRCLALVRAGAGGGGGGGGYFFLFFFFLFSV